MTRSVAILKPTPSANNARARGKVPTTKTLPKNIEMPTAQKEMIALNMITYSKPSLPLTPQRETNVPETKPSGVYATKILNNESKMGLVFKR